MKVAIVGSRNLCVIGLENFLPKNVTEIVSGGAREGSIYGRIAPLKRNLEIIAYADMIIAFWDGKSYGTKYVIDKCKKQGIPVKVYLYKPNK